MKISRCEDGALRCAVGGVALDDAAPYFFLVQHTTVKVATLYDVAWNRIAVFVDGFFIR